MPLVRAIVREPLVHFALIGALLFAGIAVVHGAARPTVVLDAPELNQLVSYWALQAQRPPTKDELKAIIQERVDEELLAREAQRLGMDRGDLIIRRRLAQKMTFASEDAAAATAPTDAELRAFYDSAKGRYATAPRVVVRQVYFSVDGGDAAADRAARAALATAKAGAEPQGEPFFLPLSYDDVGLPDLARDYGPEFVMAVAQAPLGTWMGPVRSRLGLHLVNVARRTPPATPGFEQVRAQVRDDLLADRRKRVAENELIALRAKYHVEVANIGSDGREPAR